MISFRSNDRKKQQLFSIASMGAAPSATTGKKRQYDAEDEEEVDEEGFSEMKDPSHMMLPSPVRTKPSSKMSTEQVVDNAVNDARKSFLEGNKLFREARFDEAKLRYEEALRVLREQLSPETGMMMPRVQAAALSNIGILEFSAGRYAEAKDLLSEALSLRQQEGHGAFGCAADPMDGLESLAIDLSRNRMFWQAPVTNHRLAAALKSHSSVDGVTADSLNNLAACMEVLGRLDEAKPLYEESLQLRKVVYGERSIKVAESKQNLATILDSQGFLQEAEGLLIEALSIYADTLGKSSPEAAVTMNNLAVLLTHLGRLDEAETMLRQTVKTRERVYGDDHHFTQCARQNLEYVLNKRRSLHRHEQERKQRKAAELHRASTALREVPVSEETKQAPDPTASAVTAPRPAASPTAALAATAAGLARAVESVAVLPAGASSGAEPLQGLSPASKPAPAGTSSGIGAGNTSPADVASGAAADVLVDTTSA